MADPIKLTLELKRDLNDFNWELNGMISYQKDVEQYSTSDWWAYTEDKGDCEDYMLTKALWLLMKFGEKDWGFDRANIRMTTCWVENGLGYHAVLTLITDKGDLVLDNRRTLATLAKDLVRDGYKFDKREKDQTTNPGEWESITYEV